MKLPCFVINLEDSIKNFEIQKRALLSEGLDPTRFIGINGRKDEHMYYLDNVSKICQYTCPKSVIGCGLSHILLANHIRDIGIPIALVLEDDAFPKVENLLQCIQETIQEIPDDWDIIKLHCFNCLDNTINNGLFDGSTAAYIINNKGAQKLSKLLLNNHMDIQFNYSGLIIYKSRYNLFKTDESFSTISDADANWWFDFKIPFSAGERTISQHLTGKMFRIHNTNIELEVWLVCIIILYFIYKLVFE